MDLWFSVDPATEYGRIANLITITSIAHSEIGIRISLSSKDKEKLRSDYLELFPENEDGTLNSKTLFHFLTLSGNLKKYFELKYASFF